MIVSQTAIHPLPGTSWDDLQKSLKKTAELATKHGAENVTVLAAVIGGENTNTIQFVVTAQDWSTFGKVQQSFMADEKVQAQLLEAGQLATWQTYVSQTIDL
jgi:multidrug efflux pump subunit AcrB